METYKQSSNGDIISSSGTIYEFNGELTSNYSGGDLKAQKVIGKFHDQKYFANLFLGPRVVKLKGYDGEDTFLVRGVMLQEVYTKQQR